MTPIPVLTPDTAGLLAQILPVFLLIFALEGNRLEDPGWPVSRKTLFLRVRFAMVLIDIVAIGLSIFIHQLGDDYAAKLSRLGSSISPELFMEIVSLPVIVAFMYSLAVLLVMVAVFYVHQVTALRRRSE